MLLYPTMPARIARLSIMSLVGLLLTYACGYTTSGTMAVYCGLIFMYCNTVKASRALWKKRMLIVLISIPVTILVLFALKATGLPPLVRLPLGMAVSIPLLLTINVRCKLDFSEISQVVTVAILTGSFEANNRFFLTRMFFITVGISISYLAYVYVFPLRHDKAFEAQREQLREQLQQLAQALYNPQHSGPTTEDLIQACAKLQAECDKHLQIVCEDVDIKRQYRDYRGRCEPLLWELECAGEFLFLARGMTSCQSSTDYSSECRAYIMQESHRVWQHYQDSLDRLDKNTPPLELVEPWNNSHLSHIYSERDFQMIYLLAAFKNKACSVSRELCYPSSAAII